MPSNGVSSLKRSALEKRQKAASSSLLSADQILLQLKALGSESYKRVLTTNHGVREPCFGVKISELKKFQKRIKKDYQLALDLYETGNYDAMYLAGLIADDGRMTKSDLQKWADRAIGGALAGTTVATVAAQGNHGWELGLKWIDSPKAHVAVAGWNTLSGIVALEEDSSLDISALRKLIERVEKTIQTAPDMVRYAMNGFMISVGSYVKELNPLAISVSEKIGPVHADLGNNSCQIPFAPDYIQKVAKVRGIGKKRTTVKC